jgi:hypothetical protein
MDDYSELLFAAAVHNLARELRSDAKPRGLTDEVRAKWRKENPVSQFVPEALQAICETAEQIRPINSLSQPK